MNCFWPQITLSIDIRGNCTVKHLGEWVFTHPESWKDLNEWNKAVQYMVKYLQKQYTIPVLKFNIPLILAVMYAKSRDTDKFDTLQLKALNKIENVIFDNPNMFHFQCEYHTKGTIVDFIDPRYAYGAILEKFVVPKAAEFSIKKYNGNDNKLNYKIKTEHLIKQLSVLLAKPNSEAQLAKTTVKKVTSIFKYYMNENGNRNELSIDNNYWPTNYDDYRDFYYFREGCDLVNELNQACDILHLFNF